MSRNLLTILLASVLFCLTLPATADKVWTDHAHGLTLSIPDDARIVDTLLDEAMVRFVGAQGRGDYVITLNLRESTVPVGIEKVLDTSISEIAASAAYAKVLDRSIILVGDWHTAVIYYRHADRKRNPLETVVRNRRHVPKPWIFGQALVQLTPTTILTFQLDIDANRWESGKAVFEKIFKSLKLQDAAVVVPQREQAIDRFIEWRETITPERLTAACVKEQFFRIRQSGSDLGYMRIRQNRATEMQLEGVRIDVQSRVMNGSRAIDTLSNFFLSDDGTTEIWQTLITDRDPRAADNNDLPAASWTETGLRSRDRISVNREDPTGLKEYHWRQPRDAFNPKEHAPTVGEAQGPADPNNPVIPKQPPPTYMPLVIHHLLGPLLADSKVTEMGYYAYFSANRKITYHTEKIERDLSGSYRVRSRPAPDKQEYVTHYDEKGRFVRQELPDNSEMIPATPAQLKARWKLR